ncbi:MAG TPA: DinB family protein [Tepidiformaceae bacterium]|nr:DinB family protein [Tepidiformaceae bacterium]
MADDATRMLMYLMQQAFDGARDDDAEHQALLPNLQSVNPDDWQARPAGTERSIRDIVLHVGACKYMYADHMFGSGRLDWTSPIVDPWPSSEPHMREVIEWMEAGHRKLMRHVEELDAAAMTALRSAPWGEPRETRWLLSVLLQHDLYHAGEVNHLRSVRHDDRWAFLK